MPSFNYTISERRASTSIAGSLGRSGLYIPQDFLDRAPQLEEVDDDEAVDESDEEQPLLPPAELSHTLSRRQSRQILDDENRLLLQNKVSRTPSRVSRVSRAEADESAISESWESALRKGDIRTTPWFEFRSITVSSIPLIITFLLQSSLGVCSVFAVGHISPKALAGVTLGMMSCNISAIAIIAGIASSLDTFLPQAYGAGKYKLVGVLFQRCVVIILLIMAVTCVLWWLYAKPVLLTILPDAESAEYANQYLKVMSFGIPGYVLFETGKRFLQSQGIFDASTYVLFVCAPLNAVMNYTFVWTFKMGYIGAPLAVAINYDLMALGLFLYTVYTKDPINPRKCWTPLRKDRIFHNWGEMIRLSIPNLIMIVSEFLSFEIMTLLASYLGTTSVAAQSVVATMASLTYQVPYAVSIAASTRLANFLGAQLPDAAKVTAKMVFVATVFIAAGNFSFLNFARYHIADWFSDDQEVVALIVHVLPLVASIQIFDGLNATSAGCLRGQGLQRIGGYCNLLAYYIVGIPLGAYLAFHHHLGIAGLWAGVGFALSIIGTIQCYCVVHADYPELVRDALRRAQES